MSYNGANYPAVTGLHVDAQGLLWVRMSVRASRHWVTDVRYEVIDPDAGVVLVSGLLDDGANNPFNFPGRSTIGVRPAYDSVGRITIHFVDFHLIRSD